MRLLNNYSLNKSSFTFILVNVFVASIGFIRSFVFMKFFDFKELGIITLVNTAAMLIGFFQLGLINGGYRIIALGRDESNLKTNNVIFSYFGLISLILMIISFLGFVFGLFSDWIILLVINIIGIELLITNWLTNILIGAREYRRLNISNLVSSLASLICLLLANYYGLYGALLSLLIQPFLFICIVFFTGIKEIPSNFDLDFKHIKYILNFGFIPFLSGIFFLAYQQFERWSVNLFLGPEALGKMYLVFITNTLWLLIPTSINSILFPKAVNFFEVGNNHQLQNTINKYFYILFLYCLTCGALFFFIFPQFVDYILPNHNPYLELVFLTIPALILRTMADPIGLLLNSMVKLKPILYVDIISLFCYVIFIVILAYLNIFSIKNILICYILYNLIRLVYLFVIYLIIKREIKA